MIIPLSPSISSFFSSSLIIRHLISERWIPTLMILRHKDTEKEKEKTDAGPALATHIQHSEFASSYCASLLYPICQMPRIFQTCHSCKGYFLVIQPHSLQYWALMLSLCKSGHWRLGPHILLDRSCRKNALPLWEIKQPAKSNGSLGGTEHQHENPPKPPTKKLLTEYNRIEWK